MINNSILYPRTDLKPRNISVKLFENGTSTAYDITQLVSNLSISTYLEDNPGKCSLDVAIVSGLYIKEGNTIDVKVDGYGMFKGYVFTLKRNSGKDVLSVTCYDLLRYLKNKDSYVFKGMTSDQIFTAICNDAAIPYDAVARTGYVCTARSHDNKALYEIIKYGMTDTLIHTREWFFLRDNYGVVEHASLSWQDLGILLSDKSGLIEYDYEESIDSDVYNQIKLYKDNKKTKKREIYIVNDTINGGKNLKNWGLLQYYAKVDESMNTAQIEEFARKLLYLYNAPRKKLKLNSIGYPKARAGSIISCNIQNYINDKDINGHVLVTECTHDISKFYHTMSLTVEVF